MLAFAMVLTMGAFSQLGGIVAKADDSSTNITLHFQNYWGWTTPAIQYWGGSSTTVTGAASEAQQISGWGDNDMGYALTQEDTDNANGLYSVTLTGDFEGFQFLDLTADTNGTHNATGTVSNDYMAQYNGETAQDLYYVPTGTDDELVWKWYTDADYTTELTAPAGTYTGDCTVTLHYNNSSNWSSVNLYMWDGSGNNLLGDWPGAAMTADTEKAGWYTTQVPTSGISKVNYIFNGSGGQTGNLSSDITGETLEIWYDNDTVLTEAPDSWTNAEAPGETPEALSFTNATITMHFEKPADWDEVYAYISEGSGWNAISGYAYAGTWPGAEVEADAQNAGWYSFTITMAVNQFNLIYNNNSGSQTSNIQFTPTTETTEKWVTLGTDTVISDTAPTGWVSGTSNAPIAPNANSAFTSPVVNSDNTVTVTLDATGTYASATEVLLMGTLNGTDWTTGLAMEKTSTENGDVFTVTTPVQSPGVYEYKFKIDGSKWIIDPLNSQVGSGSDPNSIVVISGLADKSMDVARGKSVALPETLSFYDADGNASDVAVTYSLEDSSLADTVTISDGNVLVAAGSTVETVVLVATYGTYTSKVTLSVKDKTYTYHIYYFDHTASHMATDAADIWAWEKDGANIGAVAFTSLETLSDGNQWLKADLTTSAASLGLIPRSKGEWSWQTTDHYFENTNDAEECNIYIVNGDSKTYSELPEIKELRERYVVVEYDRTAGDYDGWNIYSWNTGITSETEIYTEEINGKRYITVPVADYDIDFTLEFCMRRTESEENAWAEKDGGDHYIKVPADQTVVKAKFVQGEGVTEILPYNTGYEMDGANDAIHFYYRDDTLFKACTLNTLEGKVQVVVNGTTYDMSYDAENERFFYDYKGLVNGDYQYHYIVDGTDVLDAFNAKVTDDKKNSILTYKKYSVGINASVLYASMDYNDNNVLSVSFTGDEASAITTEEIESIQADLSALGLGTIDIQPELMKATIACLETTAAGQKAIPVTVKDTYGNVYTANAEVKVTERVKAADDFDWDEAIIYFAVTDRFFDGSDANNSGVDKNGSLSYHGGDFAGLNEKLDYLDELGVNTIWITPIVENSDTTTTKDGETIESTGYHGYWASDFTKLNSHLGTEAEFSALLEAAHERGMKIMVDVVINHAGYDTESYFNSVLDGVTMIRTSDNTVSGSDVYASLAGLPDFVTEDEAVRNQLIEWQTDWMDKFDIDYYRIDTVKHVDYTTWAAFRNSLAAVNPDFKMIGEYAGAGYANTAGELGTGTMDALLDFDFNDFAQKFVGGDLATVESSLVKRNTSINNTATMGSFIGSHDEDGLQYKLMNENGIAEEEALNLMKVAATLQITAKGQPVIYYGEEIGQTGANNYPYQTNRYDFDWSEQEAQQTDNSSMYNHYKTLLSIRNEYTDVFAKGTRSTVAVSNEEGYDIVARSYDGTTLYVGMNIKSEAKEVVIPVSGDADSVYTNLYDGAQYTVAADQTITISIPAAKDGGTVILTAKTASEGDDDVVEPDDGDSDDGDSDNSDSDDDKDSSDNDSKDDDKDSDSDSKDDDKDSNNDKDDDKEDVTATVTVVKPENIIEEIVESATGQKLRKLISEAGYVITGAIDVITEGMSFEVELPKTDSDLYKKAAEAMKSVKQCIQFKVIEITLYDANKQEVHELSDYVQVSLPIPAGFTVNDGEQIVVYRLADNGELIKCNTTVSNGVITFETNHFSTFIISQEGISGAPNTSDNMAGFAFAGIIILLAGAAFVGFSYKKRIVK